MELYIKQARADYLEVIDVEYPQYVFVFDGIELVENNGQIEVLVNKASVVKSDKAEKNSENIPDNEDEFLSTHTTLVINELFKEPLERALR